MGAVLSRSRRLRLSLLPLIVAAPMVVAAAPPSSASTAISPCSDDATTKVTVSGPQSTAYTGPSLSQRTRVDARTASWTREDAGDYPVIFKQKPAPNGSSLCLLGGRITSTEEETASWADVWHHTYALYTDEPRTEVRGLWMENQGDGIGLKKLSSSGAVIRGVYADRIHDDVIENDWMGDVTVEDSRLAGYVVFAGRGYGSMSGGTPDGRGNTYRITRTLVWAQPQKSVYKGPAPGTGPLFKRPNGSKEQGQEPAFVIKDSIFRIDQAPNHGDLSIPPGPHSGNVIVWTGAGRYPGPVPTGFTVTSDRGVWDRAEAAWLSVPRSQRTATGTYQPPGTTAAPPKASPQRRQPVKPAPTATVFTRSIAQASDDSEERLRTGRNSPTSSGLEMIEDGGTQQVGLRFRALPIPRGSRITRAALTFTAASSSSEPAILLLRGEASDSAGPFSTSARDLSSRRLTRSVVPWRPVAWTRGGTYQAPALTTVVQEIVNRPGWRPGNALALAVTHGGAPALRKAVAHDGDPARSASLTVSYVR